MEMEIKRECIGNRLTWKGAEKLSDFFNEITQNPEQAKPQDFIRNDDNKLTDEVIELHKEFTMWQDYYEMAFKAPRKQLQAFAKRVHYGNDTRFIQCDIYNISDQFDAILKYLMKETGKDEMLKKMVRYTPITFTEQPVSSLRMRWQINRIEKVFNEVVNKQLVRSEGETEYITIMGLKSKVDKNR